MNKELHRPPIEDRLDLHLFQPKEVHALLDDYLASAAGRGFREILIIHGKGRGVLKRRVRSILSRHPLVAGFRDADPAQGGWGATLVTLAPVVGSPMVEGRESETSNCGPSEPIGSTWSWKHLLLGLLLGAAVAGWLLIGLG